MLRDAFDNSVKIAESCVCIGKDTHTHTHTHAHTHTQAMCFQEQIEADEEFALRLLAEDLNQRDIGGDIHTHTETGEERVDHNHRDDDDDVRAPIPQRTECLLPEFHTWPDNDHYLGDDILKLHTHTHTHTRGIFRSK
eukprot:GHVR01133062.1.p1 GENE.GHVR01133062.1~~GHVR01133062.1.p1  ORF type:complete len:151 (+),score=100.02 GHVR01133062.1:42-455(+)